MASSNLFSFYGLVTLTRTSGFLNPDEQMKWERGKNRILPGGGSALLALPKENITLEEKLATIKMLVRALIFDLRSLIFDF